MDSADFFTTLYQHCNGTLEIRPIPRKGRVPNRFFDVGNVAGAVNYCRQHLSVNCYFGVATRDGKGGKKENIVNIPAVWSDIDFKVTPRDEFAKRIGIFPHRPSVAVFSGWGYHLYWLLKEPALKADVEAVEDINRRIAMALDGDFASTEAAHILRVPDTPNHKYDPAQTVRVARKNPFTYELDNFLDDLPEAPVKGIKGPAKSCETITTELERCAFIKWCRENPDAVREPLWYALITNLICVRPLGRALVHDYSRGYAKYSPAETDQKILHALDAPGPHTCQFIQNEGFRSCTACGVKAPAALLRDNYNNGAPNVRKQRIKFSFVEG